MTPDPAPQPNLDSAALLLIVVGASLRAEVADRPLAYRLRERIHAWTEKFAHGINPPLAPVVCSDIWYMNTEELHSRPTISLGGPGVNALSAFYQDKLSASTVDRPDVVVQMDPELIDLRVSIWGIDHSRTVDALEAFVRRHLDDYLRAVATQVEPREE